MPGPWRTGAQKKIHPNPYQGPHVHSRERVTRLTATLKLANKTAAEILKCPMAFFQAPPKNILKSIAFDNGGAFAKHMALTDLLKAQSYFCDTYPSWQKGGIENMNGRLRRDLPRSTNTKNMTDQELEQITLNYNMTLRKCLGGLSPIEALAKYMNKDLIFLFSRGIALQL